MVEALMMPHYTTTDFILKHLENPTAYARRRFMDFSSACNTVPYPQTLLNKLKQMEVNPYIIRWYHAFLIGRQQQVKVETRHISPTGDNKG